MADNETTGSGKAVATDKVTHSGDADQNVQIIRPAHVNGSEGSKTVVDITQSVASAVPSGALMIGGSDGTNARHLKLDTGGLILPGTGASNLGKAEDAAHTTGDVGVMMLGVRNDADSALAGTDLDYTPIAVSSAGKVVILRDIQRISVQSGGLTTATTSYTSGDQVGTQFTLANAARISGGGGIITGIQLISAADIIGPFDVVLTDSSITLASDNAAYAISDADALKIVALVNLSGAYDIGNNRIAQAFNLAIPYVCSGGTSLFAGLITRSSHTFFGSTTDLQLIVYVERY